MTDEPSERLGRNLRHLRETRGMTQHQIAKLVGLPRATWANLESGAANPTLAVIHRVALALQVGLEELIATPPASTKHYARDALPRRMQGTVEVRKLLPDKIAGVEIDRMEIPAGARLVGVPHTVGTREYLTCERGEIELWAGGERYLVAVGDVVVFRGDQRHSYLNTGRSTAVGYSVVLLAPVA